MEPTICEETKTASALDAPAAAETYSRLPELERSLEHYLVRQAPWSLPPWVRSRIASSLPWVDLMALMIFVPLYVIAGGLALVFSPLGGFGSVLHSLATLALGAVAAGCSALAIPGLFKRSRQGWTWCFYGELVMVALMVVSLDVVALLMTGLVLYGLFQVKCEYR